MATDNTTTRHDPTVHHRRSIRIPGYDYSTEGWYFVTICAWNRQQYFGRISEGIVHLNRTGLETEEIWESLPATTPSLLLDGHVFMPNHFHGLLWLPGGTDDQPGPALDSVIGPFKSRAGTRVLQRRKERGMSRATHGLWQKNYFKHVVRDDEDLAGYATTFGKPHDVGGRRPVSAYGRATGSRRAGRL